MDRTKIHKQRLIYIFPQRRRDITAGLSPQHVKVYENARRDIGEIARAAGIEPRRIAVIHARRGLEREQERGLGVLDMLLGQIKASKGHGEAAVSVGIAAGYANAMEHHGLISADELDDVVKVIGQAGKMAAGQPRDGEPAVPQIGRRARA